MFIGGSRDIGFCYSNMRMEAYGASYHIEFKNKDFETQWASYEGNTKVVPQFMTALGRAHE